MTKNTILAGMAAAALLAGCTANMNASVTPGASAAPGASTAPGSTASTSPTVSASAGATVSTGVADAAMLKIYKMGRKWMYTSTTTVAGTNQVAEWTDEVMKIEGATATVKTTMTVMGKTTDSTGTRDLSKKDFSEIVTKSSSTANSTSTYTWKQTSTGNESVTVPAGTYACMKFVGKLVAAQTATTNQASAAGNTDLDATFWASDDVGLVKYTGTGKIDMSAATKKYAVKQMPDMSNLPGMSGTGMPDMTALMSGDFKIELVLKSVTP